MADLNKEVNTLLDIVNNLKQNSNNGGHSFITIGNNEVLVLLITLVIISSFMKGVKNGSKRIKGNVQTFKI